MASLFSSDSNVFVAETFLRKQLNYWTGQVRPAETHLS